MKKLNFLFFLICFNTLLAQNPEFLWASQIKMTGAPVSITHDRWGNVYTAGLFRGVVDFDPGPAVYNLTASSVYDIFISKMDADGKFLWAKQIRSSTFTWYVTQPGISIDSMGNAYIGWAFHGTIDFDPGPGVYNLNSNLQKESTFMVKLDSSGTFKWARQFKGMEDIWFYAMTADETGSTYITGIFNGVIDFDPGPNIFNLSDSSGGVFITKLDSAGNLVWAKSLGAYRKDDEPFSIAVDRAGNVFTTGWFVDSADFDPGPAKFYLISSGDDKIFISKLDSSGNFSWAKQFSGPALSGGNGYKVVTDSAGNVYTLGFIDGTTDFDPGAGIYNLTPGTNGSSFISKLDAAGKFAWAMLLTRDVSMQGLAIDDQDGIYITGEFSGTFDFDPGPGIYNLTAKSIDNFILKLNYTGNFVWAKQLGAAGVETSYSISCDTANLYATGDFKGIVDFDPSDSNEYLLSNTQQSVYTLKWSICNSSSYFYIVQCDSFILNGQTYSATGKYKQVIQNKKGCDSIINLDLTITKKPKAKFNSQSQAGCQYVAYTFIDSSVTDTVSTSGYTYNWSFGDGTDSIYQSPLAIRNFTHIYKKSGTYSAREIFSNGFCSDSFWIINNVVILPAPKPGFTLSSHKGCTPFIFTIHDTLTADIVSKEYDFGNGLLTVINSKALDTIIRMTNAGTFVIKQRLIGKTNCITQFNDTIIIYPGLTSLDTADILYTTVTDSFATLTRWKSLPNAVSYTINNTSTLDTFFTDINAKPYLASEHYFITATDSCGNSSAISPAAQTIYLQTENRNYNDFALLTYTPYETWKHGVVSYEAEYFDPGFQSWISLNSSPGNFLSIKSKILPNFSSFDRAPSQICYRIKANEQNGNRQSSVSNVACVPFYPVVFLPSAFSPNGDGLNDFYKPFCMGLSIYIFEIYDRWGELVYSDSPESKGWDGKFRGEPAEAGPYVYHLSGVGLLNSPSTNDARIIERRGTLFLVK
jgi:gliding motility-associated-like protein